MVLEFSIALVPRFGRTSMAYVAHVVSLLSCQKCCEALALLDAFRCLLREVAGTAVYRCYWLYLLNLQRSGNIFACNSPELVTDPKMTRTHLSTMQQLLMTNSFLSTFDSCTV